MDKNFKNNINYIFDLFRKTTKVIKSCQDIEQLEGAYNYVENLERYLNTFDRTPREKELCKQQIVEFNRLLKIKRRLFHEYFD